MILLVGQLSFGMLESYKKTLLAIGTAICAELMLSRIMVGKWPHLASAYITGISVGIFVRSPLIGRTFCARCSSITSKYVLRYRGRHLWNPSNFGISALLFLAGDAAASLSIQWGNYVGPMLAIWVLGADHRLESAAVSYYGDVCASLPSLRVHSFLDDGESHGRLRSHHLPVLNTNSIFSS